MLQHCRSLQQAHCETQVSLPQRWHVRCLDPCQQGLLTNSSPGVGIAREGTFYSLDDFLFYSSLLLTRFVSSKARKPFSAAMQVPNTSAKSLLSLSTVLAIFSSISEMIREEVPAQKLSS